MMLYAPVGVIALAFELRGQFKFVAVDLAVGHAVVVALALKQREGSDLHCLSPVEHRRIERGQLDDAVAPSLRRGQRAAKPQPFHNAVERDAINARSDLGSSLHFSQRGRSQSDKYQRIVKSEDLTPFLFSFIRSATSSLGFKPRYSRLGASDVLFDRAAADADPANHLPINNNRQARADHGGAGKM